MHLASIGVREFAGFRSMTMRQPALEGQQVYSVPLIAHAQSLLAAL